MGDVVGVRNAHGLTAKQERFAQEVAKGASQSEAYRLAYDASKMKPETVYSEAARLVEHPAISARIRSLLEQQEERMLRDAVRLKRHVMKRLVEESEVSTELKTTPMSRLKALELLGKTHVVGLFRDGEGDGGEAKKPEDLERELMDKMREFFRSDHD